MPNYITHSNFVSRFNPPLLVITFDDANDTDFYYAYKEMKSRMLKGNSYIVTTYPGDSGKLTWGMIEKMLDYGWIMGCHTHNHTDLTTLDDAGIRVEMDAVDAAYTAQGLSTPVHHAYPYGASNATVKSVVAEYRQTQRTVREAVKTYANIDIEDLSGANGDMDSTAKLNIVKGYLDDIETNGSILVLMVHALSTTTLRDNFTTMLDYALTKNIRIVTLTELQSFLS